MVLNQLFFLQESVIIYPLEEGEGVGVCVWGEEGVGVCVGGGGGAWSNLAVTRKKSTCFPLVSYPDLTV